METAKIPIIATALPAITAVLRRSKAILMVFVTAAASSEPVPNSERLCYPPKLQS